MTVVRGYKTTVSDMWRGGGALNLDKVASNAVLWGTGKTRGIHRPLQVLRFRFLETMIKDKLHTQNPTKHPDKTCDLCTQTGNWYHMASMCPHPYINEYYTVRHNAAGKELTKGIRNGKLGRWLTIASFGKVDGLADPETIPTWMLSEEGRNRVKQRHNIYPMRNAGDPESGEGSEQPAGELPTRGVRGGVRPDSMILEGWPETSPPPQGPSKTYINEQQITGTTRSNTNKRKRHEKRRVTIIIGELGFSSYLNPLAAGEHFPRRLSVAIRH
jgi:hypothetical protein